MSHPSGYHKIAIRARDVFRILRTDAGRSRWVSLSQVAEACAEILPPEQAIRRYQIWTRKQSKRGSAHSGHGLSILEQIHKGRRQAAAFILSIYFRAGWIEKKKENGDVWYRLTSTGEDAAKEGRPPKLGNKVRAANKNSARRRHAAKG